MTLTEDPRVRNHQFSRDTLKSFVSEYGRTVNRLLDEVKAGALDGALGLLEDVSKNNKQVLVAGNGGSSAISDHLICDWGKGTFVPGKIKIRGQSLTSSVATLTATANDFGYDQVFAKQIEVLGQRGDLLVAISSSGNSENIVCAAQAARQTGMKVLGLTGFSGGRLRELADVSLHIPFENYGVVEDCHQALMHCLGQFLYLRDC